MFRQSLIAAAVMFAASPTQAIEIRVCERELRTASADDVRDVHSALIQAFAVVNTGRVPVTLTEVSIQVSNGGHVHDTRSLVPEDIARAAQQSSQIAMMAQILPSQFCHGQMLAGSILANSSTLAPGEALVFTYQPFVWQGVRDRVAISAVTEGVQGSSTSTIALDIVPRVSTTRLLFPVAGRSFVPVAAGFHTPHRWAAIEEFALDIVMLAESGSTFRNDGLQLSDYTVFAAPVRATAAGRVLTVADGTPDNSAMLRRHSETDEAYFERVLETQMALLAAGLEAVLGNHIVVDHGNGEYSVYAHLQQGSVRVAPGDAVEPGRVIAAVGSSGNSTEPHLHFQLCDHPDIRSCRTIPANFIGFRLPLELVPRTIQSGDIVETVE